MESLYLFQYTSFKCYSIPIVAVFRWAKDASK